ncbi:MULTISPECIES: hypothetical protein [unclassified Tolypothrix]|uniref:hypothetical protein n=1 Tax=unclassified Tolypothrix TaxID=2649714 RepID=UPI0005EAAE79|nr:MULTISPECIES: hypothetical protein [unclassified Tolypothrix]BAY91852.1 hypothetical protein NIES3275_38800 [Microchaete diplosiphon NIES-3275]EKF04989.1 hypothetical protein FDUTEX481_01153 [Tolypothrix sp. PCC 7601]MBE9081260.1 hypothetical protein [Tolypothrix sp. LEGE 11397]UYD25861.1 hypothetical protein HGR01_31780 [Tolypothrix sp. PCC 7712]UYD31901.1 hypothetical protein HG267_22750 [Tolypothrix sp. PCC 7601]
MEHSEQPPMSGNNFDNSDPVFGQQVQRLHQLTVYGRWLFVACLWLTIAPISLWNLQSEIALWRQYFTWVAVRYGLVYHPLATIGLAFCIAMTASVLIWQSRNILIGLPEPEKQRLEKQVFRIRQQGQSHPLWKWVCQTKREIKD